MMNQEAKDMSTTAEHGADAHPDYLNDGYGIRSWLLTTDHKRIAMLYLMSVTVFFLMGSVFAALIRLELATPEGDLVTPDMYNRLFTMHGVLMVFLFLIPTIPAVFGGNAWIYCRYKLIRKAEAKAPQ